MPRPPEGSTPRQLLVSWANQQDAWVRSLVALTLASKAPLSEDEISAHYERFLSEKGLSPEPAPEVAPLEVGEEGTQSHERLELVSISEVGGVNALAPDQKIEFDPCLTILFGENGSGKTGYARIVKRLAAVRTAEDILPNINETPKSPCASVEYKLGGAKTATVAWKNETGLTPFTRISVFDAPAVTIHVDSELNYIYTPLELALFSHIAEAIRGVQRRAEEEASSLQSASPNLLSRFNRGNKIYPLIETLGVTTDLGELTGLGTLDPAERERRAILEAEIAALKGSGLSAILTSARTDAERQRRILQALDAAVSFDVDAYEQSRQKLEDLRAARRVARDQAFGKDELAGDPDDEWQAFIGAAEHYREHLALEPYPQTGDNCLYCRQALTPNAVDLIARYRSFLDDRLASEALEAERATRALSARAGDARLQVVESDLAELVASESKPEYADQAQRLVADLASTIELTGQLLAAPHGNLPTRARELATHLRGALAEADQKVTDLEAQVANSTEALKAREAEFADLDARVTLESLLPSVTSYVESAKRASRLTSLVRGLSTGTLRPLTELSKIASEDLVNNDFERLFREECQELRAPTVGLEFQGRRGRAERKKAVASYKPSSVLSEGEQKVLALADFLAEGRMGAANAPIVFDDPVTSLDYKRMAEVAGRISNLAETHQVVVLTHNIVFASSLLALRTGKKVRCKFYEVRDEEQRKGVIMPAAEPRSDTPADFEKKLNVLLQNARQAEPVVKDALVAGAYGLLRSWCEAFVEQEVLCNVSQRFRVNIMMTNLTNIKADRLQVTASALAPIFDRCSRFMPGHSQPQEQLNVQPSLTDFEKDLAEAKGIRKNYLAA